MKVVVGECEEQINAPINSLLVMFKREWVKKKGANTDRQLWKHYFSIH